MTTATTTTKYSIAAASRVTGKSRNTIAKHLKQGMMSFEEDGSGAKLIDASELIRVYDAKQVDFEREQGSKQLPAVVDPQTPTDTHWQERLDREIEERQRERRQLTQQIEQLQESLRLAQEGHNRATLMLQDQRTGGGDRLHQEIQREVADATALHQKQYEKFIASARRQIEHYRRQLEEERRKNWWRRLIDAAG